MQVVENFCSFILPIFLLSVHGTFFFCLGIFYEKKKQSGEYKKMTPLEEQRLKKEAGYHKMNQCRDCAYYSRRGSYLSTQNFCELFDFKIRARDVCKHFQKSSKTR